MFRRLRNFVILGLACAIDVVSDNAAWSNALIIAGGASISAGAYWIYRPLGPIVAGVAAIAIAVLMHADPPEYE